MNATAQSTTYTGSSQGYPTSDVTVTGANGLSNSGGVLSFTYNGSSTAPTTAGTYSVVVTFMPKDATDYADGTATTTWTIKPAVPVITWNNPSAIAYFTPLGSNQLNAAANVPGTFVYTPPAGTQLGAGTHTLSAKFTPSDSTEFTAATATVQVVVLGPGVSVVGSQLYIVGGTSSCDQVQVNPAGCSNTCSTGVKIDADLNGVITQATYGNSFTTIAIFLQGGNDTIQLASSLTISAVVTAGNGNDNVQLGNGANTTTLGNGNDNIQAGNGSNTVMAGSGNDNVQLGNGANTITLGNGNDNIQAGNGSNTVMAGSGNDNVQLGNDSYDNVTLGNGNDNVQIGNGSYQTVVLGNGNDNVQLGNGSDDDVTVGTGNDNIQIGNGNNNTVFLPAKSEGHYNIKFGNGSNNSIE